MNADIHALTGAYALNAIPEFERAEFERHLVECESCAQEVRELQATATRLGEAASEAPPPELKARVLARIAEVRQLPPVDDLGARRERRSGVPLATKLFGAAAAVFMVISVSLGVLLVRNGNELDQSRDQAAAMSNLLSARDARVVSGTAAGGLSGTVLLSRDRGQVMLLAGNVPAAPEGKTYQVWLMGEGAPKSIGLMVPDASGQASLLNTGGVGNAENIGVTVEPSGGSVAPSPDVVMQMALPA
ncbi:anti-sigma factor [Actinokineospora sp. G85]|uniref:anti-sigma factor n=1 Tax=Actinokineospora sp. G85 TaxID=3406626 RepID=UPI003C77DC58